MSKKIIHLFSFSLPLFLFNVESAYAQSVVGTITPPGSIAKSASDTGKFLSVIFRFVIVLAGIYSLWQFLSGGFQYITSNGDKGKVAEATSKITMSITGLVTIGISFILTAVISRLLFGSFTAILSPTVETL